MQHTKGAGRMKGKEPLVDSKGQEHCNLQNDGTRWFQHRCRVLSEFLSRKKKTSTEFSDISDLDIFSKK
jgi:hypothetical protein